MKKCHDQMNIFSSSNSLERHENLATSYFGGKTFDPTNALIPKQILDKEFIL